MKIEDFDRYSGLKPKPSYPPSNLENATLEEVLDPLPEGANGGELIVTVRLRHPSYARQFEYHFLVKTKVQQDSVCKVLTKNKGERLYEVLLLGI